MNVNTSKTLKFLYSIKEIIRHVSNFVINFVIEEKYLAPTTFLTVVLSFKSLTSRIKAFRFFLFF